MGRKSSGVSREEKVHPANPESWTYCLTVTPLHSKFWPTRDRDALPKLYVMVGQLLGGVAKNSVALTAYDRQQKQLSIRFQVVGDAEGKFVDRLPKLVANKALKHAWDFAGFTVEPPKVRAADAPEPVV